MKNYAFASEKIQKMKITRSDLGFGHSSLPLALCFKIPKEKNLLAAQLLKLEIDWKRIRLLQENRKIKCLSEVDNQTQKTQKLENKIQMIKCRTHEFNFVHHECRCKRLVSSSERFAIDRMTERAKQTLKKQ